jgi:hypothetical protein
VGSSPIARVRDLSGIGAAVLPEIGAATKRECTISVAIGGVVEVSFEVVAE